MSAERAFKDDREQLILPVRPRPIFGELTVGYLIRVSYANGYDNPRALATALKLSGFSSEQQLWSTLLLNPEEQSRLKGPVPHYWKFRRPLPGDLRAEDFNHHYMRWCPACLAESSHWRVEWGIKLYCVCVTHGVQLIDRCGRCGEQARLERPCVDRCMCGHVLSESKTGLAAHPMVSLQRGLIQKLQSLDGDFTDEMSPGAWLRMARYLGAFDNNPLPIKVGKVGRLHDCATALSLLSGAANVLTDWPHGFQRMLANCRSMFKDASHIGEAFGPLYRVLYRELGDQCFDFLRQAFELYLRENWFGLLGRRNRRLAIDTINQHHYKPLSKIAKAAGTSKSLVRHLANSGEVRGSVVRHQSGRETWAIPKSEVHRIRNCADSGRTLRDVESALVLGRRRVLELIDAGVLGVWLSPKKSTSSTWLISKEDVDKLVSISSRTILSDAVEVDSVSISHICRTWQLKPGEFPALVRALLSGTFRNLSRLPSEAGFGNTRLGSAEIRNWLRANRDSSAKWLSVDAAAKLLAVKQQVAYALISRKLLNCETGNQGGRTCRWVSRDAVRAFQEAYVSLAQLASIQGTSARKLLVLIDAQPVCGPSVDGVRQYFYRREDVRQFEIPDASPSRG